MKLQSLEKCIFEVPATLAFHYTILLNVTGDGWMTGLTCVMTIGQLLELSGSFQFHTVLEFLWILLEYILLFVKSSNPMLVLTGEEPPESLFMKELRRRGMNPTSLLEETNTNIKEDEETKSREEDGVFYRRNALPTDSGRNLTNQREQSMALNSEGLEVGRFPPYTLFGFWF